MNTYSDSVSLTESTVQVFSCPVSALRYICLRAVDGDIRLVSGGGSRGLRVCKDEAVEISHEYFKPEDAGAVLTIYAYADNVDNSAAVEVYGWTA